jgi:hypothetical protein
MPFHMQNMYLLIYNGLAMYLYVCMQAYSLYFSKSSSLGTLYTFLGSFMLYIIVSQYVHIQVLCAAFLHALSFVDTK